MGIFDSIKDDLKSYIKKEAEKTVQGAIDNAVKNIGKGLNRTETFKFNQLPNNLDELKRLPEASLDSAFKAASLTVVALTAYEKDVEACYEMLNYLKGPSGLSNYEKQFIDERLKVATYKPRSFFNGSSPENSYKPTTPYTLKVSENPYSFDEENWATLYVKSSGADNPSPIKLRKKPSTGQWFLYEIQCLTEIRIPVEEDPWA